VVLPSHGTRRIALRNLIRDTRRHRPLKPGPVSQQLRPARVNGRRDMTDDAKTKHPCAGCAFSYTLTAKGTVRKHNSRTGPGLCDGAGQPPREEPEAVETAPPEIEILAQLHPSDTVRTLSGQADKITDTPDKITDTPDKEAETPPVTSTDTVRTAPDKPSATVDMFADPAPAPSQLPPVSGQPEPSRDRWGRYLIQGQPHTRATSFAGLVSETFALNQWQQRMVIKGMAMRPDLAALAHGLEVKSDSRALNSIAQQAKEAAGNRVAANIGTAYHAFTERLDAGLITVDEVPPQYRDRVAQYADTMRRARLTTRPEWIERSTAVRADQVESPLPVAGTMDRILQLPGGDLVIGDLKTGSDLSYGWDEISTQLAVYAHGVNTHGLFDWNTNEWQTRDASGARLHVRTDIAIVMHLPADKDGCTLYQVDLVKGWERAQVCGRVMTLQKSKETLAVPFASSEELPPAPPDKGTFLHAVSVFETAHSKENLAMLYQYAVDAGQFTAPELERLVQVGKERLAQLGL
jgi:hypothetical protein